MLGTDDGQAAPCFANVCGDNGTCRAVNGFSTCDCADGLAAAPNSVGAQTCAVVVDAYDPTQILWNNHGCGGSCSTADRGSTGWLALLGVLALPPTPRVEAFRPQGAARRKGFSPRSSHSCPSRCAPACVRWDPSSRKRSSPSISTAQVASSQSPSSG